MAKANVKAKTAAKRETPRPRLVDLGERSRIEFSPDGASHISHLLEIGARLPMTRWDAERNCYVAEIDADEKSGLLSGIREGALGLTQIVKLIGLLLASESKDGYFEHGRSIELGFAINGLADLTEQLLRVEADLAVCEPVGVA
jgi:hypothetical protein